MSIRRFAALVGLSLLFAKLAHAGAEPISIETKWNSNIYSTTTTGFTAMTLDIGGFASQGYNVAGGTYIANGTDGTIAGTVLPILSTTTNVWDFQWWTLVQGSTATLTIAQTIKTPPTKAFGVRQLNGLIVSSSPYTSQYPGLNFFTSPQISTTSPIAIASNTVVSMRWTSEIENPIFYFTGLSVSATTFFWTEFGRPRQQ